MRTHIQDGCRSVERLKVKTEGVKINRIHWVTEVTHTVYPSGRTEGGTRPGRTRKNLLRNERT